MTAPGTLPPTEPHGAFLSVLDWLDKFGEIPRNLLNGNVEGAGRQAIDLVSGPIRALIPGDQSDWEQSRPQDFVHGSDLLGVDRKEHPWLGMGADIVGDFATDPLSWLSFGTTGAASNLAKAGVEGVDAAEAAAKAAQAGTNGGVALKIPFTKIGTPYAFEGSRVDPLSLIGKGANKIVGQLPQATQDTVNNAVLKTKSFMGWLKANPAADAALAQASAQRMGVAGAGKSQVEKMLKGVPDDLASRFVDIVDPADATAETAQSRFSPIADQITNWKSRIDAAADMTDEQKNVLKGLADQYGPYAHQQWQAAHQDFPAFSQAMKTESIPSADNPAVMEDVTSPLYDISKESPTDYMPRQYKGISESDKEYLGSPSALKDRSLPDSKSLGEFMDANPGITRNKDLRDILTTRSNQAGTMAERATIGKFLAGDSFKSLTDDASRAAANDAIKAMRETDPESAMLLDAKFNGLPAPKGLEKFVSKLNSYFKQSAVAGAVLPKISSITRNTLGHPMQLAMTEGMGDQALKQLLASPQTWWQGMKSSLEKYIGKSLPGDQISSDIQAMHEASAQAGGRFSNAVNYLKDNGRPDLADAMKNGVIDAGFVNQDGPDILRSFILKAVAKTGVSPDTLDRVREGLAAPGAGFTGSENYARMRAFKSLVEKGATPEEAAASQREAFYNYGTQTKENRAFRTYVPFGAFTAGALKQGATGLSRNLALNDVLNPLYGQDDSGPVPPFVQDQMRLPIGQGPDGHDHYLSGFAQPIETLNDIPNLTGEPLAAISRELQRTAVASSAPAIKTAYGLVTGKDPYFDTPYASYDRIPLIGDAGVAGRAYNALAGTGLIQPIDALLKELDRPTDSRLSAGERAIETLTGAHVLDVDPQQALIQQLQEDLKNDVNAHPSSDFWSTDPATQQLLTEYRHLKAQHQKNSRAFPQTQ